MIGTLVLNVRNAPPTAIVPFAIVVGAPRELAPPPTLAMELNEIAPVDAAVLPL